MTINEKMLLWAYCLCKKCHLGLLIALFSLGYDLTADTGVQAWTYHYSIRPNRDWNSARQWCLQHYTDMVAIQNQREIAYLNENLPKNRYYYWIGIRKLDGVWTWVGTNKTLTLESENWAKGEPNNRGTHEETWILRSGMTNAAAVKRESFVMKPPAHKSPAVPRQNAWRPSGTTPANATPASRDHAVRKVSHLALI
ncbi:hypothetical protein AAFF_G00159600 [Aldrovandia affinis]|uniref:C-type lectin domain-containing protein n=1 Tax=Aldrovandia affinis TaxID=143900 RepID=A0AAD7W8B4_9TELE|nr:hypothetical protein AAFF_G00159600 [Aldrovandia affinis]